MNSNIESSPLIILAGGQSSRMGTPKGLVEIKEKNLLEYQLETFFQYGGKKIVLVLGYHQTPYYKQMPWLTDAIDEWTQTPYQDNTHLKIVINDDYNLGQFSSLQAGISSILEDNFDLSGGAFVLPIDVPVPPQHIWQTLLYFQNNNILVTYPQFKERGGHPVCLSNEFMKNLLQVPIESIEARLDIQIKKLPKKQKKGINFNNEALSFNINTPEDLSHAISLIN
ncbi:MAG: NTP transferase domain-containing protein [Bacteriovoracaceae bacterium]|nr:NTP transferase domain-containing protein [Bacteriovoracaceae bacterium]